MYKATTATRKIVGLTKRVRIVQGGTSASKTISILLYLIDRAQTDKRHTLTSIVSESLPHLKRGAMRDFLLILKEHKYYKEANWNRTDYTYTFETGAQIEFFGAEQGDKLRGARRDRLFINEANNVPFEAFEQLEVRTNEFCFIDYNPTNEFWAMTEVMASRNDWERIVLTYLDNEALPDEVKKSIEQRKERKGWWTVYGLGELGEIEGKIYNDWQIIGEEDMPRFPRLERYGLDFGYSIDPTSIVAVYYADGGYILDEVMYQKGLSNKQIADTLLNNPQALVIADSAEPKSIDEIRGYGVPILGAEKGADSVRNGIQMVQGAKIAVTKRSVNIIREYRSYLWKTDRNGEVISPNIPEAGFDHSMDAIRYAMTSILKQSKPVEYIASESISPYYGDRDMPL